MTRFLCTLVLFLSTASLNSQAQMVSGTGLPANKVIRLATLEWPPYNGQLLPLEGLSTRIATVVAKAAGYRLLSASFDWTVAVQKGEKDPGFEGYFPAYFSKEREQSCHLSQSIGTSVLGLATLKTAPINWTAVPDLAQYKIGVVEGYVNGQEFDEAIKQNRQPVEAAASDAVNVKKLREGKIRGIVIDRNVLSYTLSRSGAGDQIIFNPRALTQQTLHVCFKRTPAGLEMRNAFDEALKKNDPAQLEADYLKTFLLVR